MRFPSSRLALVLIPAALSSFAACKGAEEEATDAELPPAGLAGGAAAADAAPPVYDGLMALPPEEKIVTVGESVFTRADLERAMIHTAARVGVPPGQLPADAVAALELPSFKQLLKRGLLFEEAKKRGLVASDVEVKAERDRLVSRLSDGRTLADVLKNMRSDEAAFERDLRIDLSVKKLMEKVYGELPKVDEKAARALYERDKDRWGSDDRVSVSHILVGVAADAPADVVAKAEARAEALRAKVVGQDKQAFAKVAREQSEDPSAKQNGGDLGWFSKREMLPGFAEAAFALKAGEVSSVVRSDRGFHVLLGQGVKKQSVPFDDVKDRIIATEIIAQRTDVEKKLLATLEESTKLEIHHQPRGVPAGASVSAAADATAASPHGAGAMGAEHMGLPLPSADNVLPGAQNPHGGDLKLDGSGAQPSLQLKLGATPPPPGAP